MVAAFISRPLGLANRLVRPLRSSNRLLCSLKDPSSPSTSESLSSPTNLLLVNGVPFLWGSYTPVAKIFLTVNPVPVPLFNFFTYFASLASVAFLPRTDKLPLRKGAELGTYLFIGTYTFLFALSLTTASRAAFFGQLTTVFVPLLRAALGEKEPPSVYIASLLALIGVGIFAEGDLTGGLNQGDWLAVFSALAYSVHVLRLEVLSTPDVLGLVQSKAMVQTALAAVVLALTPTESFQWLKIFPSMQLWDILSLSSGIAYIGAATTALATWMQVVGQQRVGPTRCAIYYTSQPIYAALLSQLVGVDSITNQEIFGGFFIILSALVVVLDGQNGGKSSSENSKLRP